jgi:hypothetical protein
MARDARQASLVDPFFIEVLNRLSRVAYLQKREVNLY